MNLYHEIARRIVEDIQSGLLPEKLPAWRALEQRYEVSRGSIEKAFGLLSSMGVVAHRGGRAYYYSPRPAKEPKRIGILSATPPFDHFLTEFYEESVYRIQELLGSAHSIATEYVGMDPEVEKNALKRFLRLDLDGVFAFPLMRHQRLVNLDLYREFEIRGIRLVFLYRNVTEVRAPSVYYDPRGLIDAFVSRLRGQGCTHFLDLGKTTRRFSGDMQATFQLFFADQKNCFSADLPEDLPRDRQGLIAMFVDAIEALKLPRDVKLGCIVTSDAHAHLADLALRQVGQTAYEIVTDGLMKHYDFDVYKIDPKEIDPRFFNGPRLDYRAREIGEWATHMMQAQLRNDFSCSYSLPLPPRWNDVAE